MDKYLSVITNFGCHYSCPYCIVKNNNLQIPKSTVEGLDRLEEEIKKESVQLGIVIWWWRSAVGN